MKTRILLLLGMLLLLSVPLLSEEIGEDETNWIHVEEENNEKIPMTKLEKAESELEYMNERVDFYQRVVRSVEREEAELKELRKLKIRNTKGLKK